MTAGPMSSASLLRPSMDFVYLGGTVLACAIRGLIAKVPPNDFWFHAATGRTVAATGRVPTVDAFTFTMEGTPYVNGAWLSDLGLYVSYDAGGLTLVLLLHAAAVAGTFLLLVVCARELGASSRVCALAVGLFALVLASSNLEVRPQTLAYPLFVGCLLILWRCRAALAQGRRPTMLWLLVPLLLVWVNLHGSFPLGLALLGAFLLSEAIDRFRQRGPTDLRPLALPVAIAVLTAVTTLVNPTGLRIYSYVASLMSHPAMRAAVDEWHAPTWSTFTGKAFFIGIAVVLVALWTGRKKVETIDVVLLLIFALLGLQAIRNVVWFSFVGATLLSRSLAGRMADRPSQPGSAVINAAILVFLLSFAVVVAPGVRQRVLSGAWATVTPEPLPDAAVAVLQTAQPKPRRIFDEVRFGSYLAWAAPDLPFFIDPRFELYPIELIRDYQALSNGVDVPRLFETYGFDAVFAAQAEQAKLIALLKDDPEWRLAYEDEISAVFLPAR